MAQHIQEEQLIDAPSRQTVLTKQFLTIFKKGDPTPSVQNIRFAKAAGVAVTITEFKYGQEAQDVSILGDGVTTVANNANITTNTGANKLLDAGEVYRFTNFDGIWREDSLDGAVSPTDVYDKATSDARFVNVTGDTMTGNLLFTDNTVDVGQLTTDRIRKLYSKSGVYIGGHVVSPFGLLHVISDGLSANFTAETITNLNGSVNFNFWRAQGTFSAKLPFSVTGGRIVQFTGSCYNGTGYSSSCGIGMYRDNLSTSTTADVPGLILFETAGATGVVVTRWRLTHQGHIFPHVTGVYDIGGTDHNATVRRIRNLDHTGNILRNGVSIYGVISLGAAGAESSDTITVPIQIKNPDGTNLLTNLIDVVVTVSDSATSLANSGTATLSLGALGTILDGTGTAKATFRPDANGRIDVVVTDASVGTRYLNVTAGGNSRLIGISGQAALGITFA